MPDRVQGGPRSQRRSPVPSLPRVLGLMNAITVADDGVPCAPSHSNGGIRGTSTFPRRCSREYCRLRGSNASSRGCCIRHHSSSSRGCCIRHHASSIRGCCSRRHASSIRECCSHPREPSSHGRCSHPREPSSHGRCRRRRALFLGCHGRPCFVDRLCPLRPREKGPVPGLPTLPTGPTCSSLTPFPASSPVHSTFQGMAYSMGCRSHLAVLLCSARARTRTPTRI